MTRAAELPVAALQFAVGADKRANTVRAAGLVARAASDGARLVVLPEKWTGLGSPEILRAVAERVQDGEAVAAMRGWAVEHGVHLIGGSITECHDDGRLTNTSLAIDPSGAIVSTYRKLHLFDVDLGEERYRESDVETAGDEIVVVEVEGWKVGLTICYDLRFPELHRILALRGAELIVVPAAFTAQTGRAHWEVLLRARAIENQCWVLAAGECGEHPGGKRTYGHSMVVDPWGVVVAQAAEGETVVSATVDASRVAEVRAAIPALTHRRPDAYAWPQAATDRAT